MFSGVTVIEQPRNRGTGRTTIMGRRRCHLKAEMMVCWWWWWFCCCAIAGAQQHDSSSSSSSSMPLLQGQAAGDPVPCQQLVFFDQGTLSVDDGIRRIEQHLQSSGRRRALLKSASLPILRRIGPQEGVVSAAAVTTAPSSFIVGLLLQACETDATDKQLVADVAAAPGVAAVVPNVVVTSTAASCLSPSTLGGVLRPVLPDAAWPGCLGPGLALAWWGRRCSGSPDQVQWQGVFAFSTKTGVRLPACDRHRSGNSTDSIWLGSCGEPPGVSPNTPAQLCPGGRCMAATDSGTYSSKVSLVHPDARCAPGGAAIKMWYRGTACGDGLIRWTSAAQVKGQPGVPTGRTCNLQWRPPAATNAGAAASSKHFNREWFGDCGVAPARVKNLPTCFRLPNPPPPPPSPSPNPPPPPQSPSPPPPPPPPPSPEPPPPPSPSPAVTDASTLTTEPVQDGEAPSFGLRRVLAITPSNTVPAEDNWSRRPAAVAIIDSGIYCRHPDLNVVANMSVFDGQSGCSDDYGHGTHLAGIAGARNQGWGVLGAAPGVPLLAVRALDERGASNVALMLDSLNALLGYRPPEPHWAPRVASMSLTWQRQDPQALAADCAALAQVQAAGIVIVAAAGNSNKPYSPWILPAACPGVLAVTAVDAQGPDPTDTDKPAAFSNYGLTGVGDVLAKTVAAPGVAINSSMAPGSAMALNSWRCPDPNKLFCKVSGTSQSVPLVSGLMARCYSSGNCTSTMSAAELVAQLMQPTIDFNNDSPGFGFAGDPLRGPVGSNDANSNYYGWLVWGGAWMDRQ